MNDTDILAVVVRRAQDGELELFDLFTRVPYREDLPSGATASSLGADDDLGRAEPPREALIAVVIDLLERGLIEMFCAPRGLWHSKSHEWMLLGPDQWRAALREERNRRFRGSENDGPEVILAPSARAESAEGHVDLRQRDWLAKFERRWPRPNAVSAVRSP